MPIILNVSDIALPNPTELDRKLKQRMYGFQQRASLPFKDKNTDLEPLTEEEREEMERLELAWNDRRPPKWGPLTFPFKPFGEQGCAWDLRYDIAGTLLAIHPKRLREVREGDDLTFEVDGEMKTLPAGIRPLRLRRVPSIKDMTPGCTEAEAHDFGLVLREGGNIAAGLGNKHVVASSGWTGAAGGGGAASERGVGGGRGVETGASVTPPAGALAQAMGAVGEGSGGDADVDLDGLDG